MELLIPGLILVALMVWASTKIKKTAADAFEPEFIETESYSLQKPEGFLHVIDDPDHEFNAYSRDFGKGDKIGIRQATIEIDVLADTTLSSVRESLVNSASNTEVTVDAQNICELNGDESANENAVRAFYKIVDADGPVYRMRFAVVPEYKDDYLQRIEATLSSFVTKTN